MVNKQYVNNCEIYRYIS